MPTKRKPKAKGPPKRPPKGSRLLRTSERSAFDRCRWQWGRTYGEQLQPRIEHPALRFGTLIHGALEGRYPPGIKRGPHPARTFEKLYDANLKATEQEWGLWAGPEQEKEWTDARELGVDMLEGYIETYGKDEEWRVVQSEMKFAVPVYLSAEMAETETMLVAALLEAGVLTAKQVEGLAPLFWYVGTMDGVWESRMDARIRINDYKTTSGDAIKEGEAKGVLDEQATAYWVFGVDYLIAHSIMKPREVEALDGMLYTMLKKSKRDDRPTNADGLTLNKDGSISKVQPAPRFHRQLVYRTQSDRDAARVRVVQEFLEMEAVASGLMSYRKSPGVSYPTMQCKGCSVRDLCELDEAGRDWNEAKELLMTHWDGYSAHEIEQEGKEG